MNEPTQGPAGSNFNPVRLLVTVAVILAVAGVIYSMQMKKDAEAYPDQRMANIMGLGHPVTNKLDTRFADADGDLVADAPAETIDPPALVFSYVANDEAAQDAQLWKPFVDHLSEATGKPVTYSGSTKNRHQLIALNNGELHVTAFNTGNVPLAVNVAGFVPVAVPADAQGASGYRMKIIVPKDSTLESLADLKGKTLTLTEYGSNSGYRVPLRLLVQHKMRPNIDVKVTYSFGHEQSIKGVAAGAYGAAAVASDMIDQLVAAGEVRADRFRSIYESEHFPPAALGYAHNLDPELAEKVRRAILSFDFEAAGVELGNARKFAAVTYKDDWALIRNIDDQFGQKHELPALADSR